MVNILIYGAQLYNTNSSKTKEDFIALMLPFITNVILNTHFNPKSGIDLILL